MSAFTIGQLARRAEVNVETVRYYERRGLLRVPDRRGSGYRHYGAGDVARLQVIRHAQRLGFTLSEILQILPILGQARPHCSSLKRHAERKMAELSRQISELEQARSALAQLIAACTREAGSKTPCQAVTSLALAEL
jgi:MerR family mercuric resistance operon transcriptional regulator